MSIITQIEKIGMPTEKTKMQATAHILVKEIADGQDILTSFQQPRVRCKHQNSNNEGG
jgi:hypothetical protein